MWCPRCDNELPDGHRFCNRCGGPLEAGPAASPAAEIAQPMADRPAAGEWRCHDCGRLNAVEHRTCRSCGSKMPGLAPASPFVQQPTPRYVAPGGPNYSPGPPATAKWVLAACGLVIIVVVAVLATKPACEKARLDSVFGSFAAVLLDDRDSLEERLDRARCPLGFKISYDLVDGPTCPVHGELDEEDVEKYLADDLQIGQFPW